LFLVLIERKKEWVSYYFRLLIEKITKRVSCYFVFWLVFHGALVTRGKMAGWGFTGDSSCLLCRACIESQAHLFFSCSFSRRIWQTIMQDCSVHNPPTDWDELVFVECGRDAREKLEGLYSKNLS
jgi:hypothetical protein